MLKYVLGSMSAVLMSASSVLAYAPGVAVSQVNTPYGKFSCTQRAQNKFYALNASNVEVNDGAVWGIYGDNRLLVWCRGDYAFLSIAGPNASDLRDEIKQVF